MLTVYCCTNCHRVELRADATDPEPCIGPHTYPSGESYAQVEWEKLGEIEVQKPAASVFVDPEED